MGQTGDEGNADGSPRFGSPRSCTAPRDGAHRPDEERLAERERPELSREAPPEPQMHPVLSGTEPQMHRVLSGTSSCNSRRGPTIWRSGRRPSVGEVLQAAVSFGNDFFEPERDEDRDLEEEAQAHYNSRRSSRRESGVFLDAEAMKAKVRMNLFKEQYDVSKYYKKEGIWREIAMSQMFSNITLSVIALNAVWIGVDTDLNTAHVLFEAAVPFQLAEHCFCFFFSFEWFVRFKSFARKRNGLRDGWFVFDTLLVLMMVMETWVLSCVMIASGSAGLEGLGNASILRMARLARLTRMVRMARLLRAMPELMILIKGIAAATRSVFFTLCLLCLLLYIFGIAFTQLTEKSEVGDFYFPNVPASMYTLLMCGTLMDNIGEPLKQLGDLSFFFAALYLLFVLLATITVMNMLIGVLCEVVSAVAATEKESLTVSFLHGQLKSVMKTSGLDKDNDGRISKQEFSTLLEYPTACRALKEVGVDVINLVDNIDFIFPEDEQMDGDDEGAAYVERQLSFGDFMELVLMLRGSNNATVKDIVDLRKFIKTSHERLREDMKKHKLTAGRPNAREVLAPPKAADVAAKPPPQEGSDPQGKAVCLNCAAGALGPLNPALNGRPQGKAEESEMWHRRAMLVDALVTAQSELVRFVETLPASESLDSSQQNVLEQGVAPQRGIHASKPPSIVLLDPLRVRWLPGELSDLKGQLSRLQQSLTGGLTSLQRVRETSAPRAAMGVVGGRPRPHTSPVHGVSKDSILM
mmetsp:Transcript_64950/g.186640  ORF Transcript_64950/g.186640 Transcript_64950/m.186640 type:complete len:751 (-) Transcript_64950:97-2349(-)